MIRLVTHDHLFRMPPRFLLSCVTHPDKPPTSCLDRPLAPHVLSMTHTYTLTTRVCSETSGAYISHWNCIDRRCYSPLPFRYYSTGFLILFPSLRLRHVTLVQRHSEPNFSPSKRCGPAPDLTDFVEFLFATSCGEVIDKRKIIKVRD